MKKSILRTTLAIVMVGSIFAVQPSANAQTPSAQEQTIKKPTKAELRRQQKAEAEARQIVVIDSIIAARSFVFVAERALTQLREITLNYRVSLSIDKTKIISQLPYYGESSSVAYGSTGSPLDFEAEEVTYQSAPLTNKKNGKAFVLLTAKSNGKSYNIGIEIFTNGAAAMSVTLNGSSPQAFYGWIEPIAQKK